MVIGRNEGERLITCLRSVSEKATIVYVDSNSTDDSVANARGLRAHVVELDLTIPFTAARARNAGFARLLELLPDLVYVQFLDGDCELVDGWLETAVPFLDAEDGIAAVCGLLRERHPDRSVYNWLCDQEWKRPTGDIPSFAGNVLLRAGALKAVGGYREDVIAAEEDELCVRLRRVGWRIWRLPNEMAIHDASMVRFAQWWQRARRAGYAFAQGANLHGSAPERHFVRETRRAIAWGLFLPLGFAVLSLARPQIGWFLCVIYSMQFARLVLKGNGPIPDRMRLTFFQVLSRFPEAIGVTQFWRDRLLRRRPRLIEHK